MNRSPLRCLSNHCSVLCLCMHGCWFERFLFIKKKIAIKGWYLGSFNRIEFDKARTVAGSDSCKEAKADVTTFDGEAKIGKFRHHRPQLMKRRVHACNLNTRNDRPTLFFPSLSSLDSEVFLLPLVGSWRGKERKKRLSLQSCIHILVLSWLWGQSPGFTPSITCLNTHFSKSIIGSCAWCGSMKGRLSILSKIGWCWNGFIHRLIITRLNTSRNPSRDATLSISGPIEHSIHYEIPRNWFTKRNSGSLITPQNEATFFLLLLLIFHLLSCAELNGWHLKMKNFRSEVDQSARATANWNEMQTTAPKTSYAMHWISWI